MTIIEALEFKAKLNKFIRRLNKYDWEQICEAFPADDFSIFLTTKIGKIWLKSNHGQNYFNWQNG